MANLKLAITLTAVSLHTFAAGANSTQLPPNSISTACAGAEQCKTDFAKTRAFIEQHSDMKVKSVDQDAIITYVPTNSGQVGLQAVLTREQGQSQLITLTVHCQGYGDETDPQTRQVCDDRVEKIKRRFHETIEQK
ncbi:hypothetical protein [Chitinolyticbacter meiyuanensis]|uniref:hypothetical protein n=1 Tax=Chitinolyticbacter meiyuanensis TaxID=682798 RepID=UPI0011E5ED45|nr:hypothetical protein [Chitinolyticbacter meiyuanensis]